MSVNKKSISAQALTEMKEITKAIKEESKDTLKAMLSEAVKDALRESIEDDDDLEIFDDDECCEKCGKCGDECKCDKKDTKDSEKSKSKKRSGSLEEDGEEDEMAAQQDPNAAAGADQAQMGQGMQDPNAGAQAQGQMDASAMNAPVEGEGEMQGDLAGQYQGDGDTLDLTGEKNPEEVLRVYKALPNDAQIVVVRNGDKIDFQDNETGAKYIIELGADVPNEEVGAEEEPAVEDSEAEQISEGYLFEISDDILEDADGEEFDEYNSEEENPEMTNEEILFEIDLGYTDNYQDKDPIDGLSNSEPSKSGRSWHKGIPTGTEKPWAGKGTEKKGDPFDNSVNENLTELDDEYFAAGLNDTGVADVETEDGMPFDKRVDEGGARTSVKKTHRVKSASNEGNPKIGVRRSPNSDNGTLEDGINVNEAMNKLKAKNKKLNEAVSELHNGLKEAYMTNVNLGKITKLFLENVTTQEEKLNIVERFSNEAKTPKQAQALYEAISKQLTKAGAGKAQMTESNAAEKTVVKENKIYKSQDLLNTIDLMNRIINL